MRIKYIGKLNNRLLVECLMHISHNRAAHQPKTNKEELRSAKNNFAIKLAQPEFANVAFANSSD